MRRLFYISGLIPLLLAGCGEKNDMVLDNDEMASLMADIHIAEAVVDLNRNDFEDDSSKMLLKQSIYAAHGVTAEQVDSSYIWYGHHIEDYMKVYEKTIQILTDRQSELLAASDRQIAAVGDSVDIWPMAGRYEFSHNSPSRIVTFSIPSDSNWQNNDVFTLRFNMATSHNPVTARMVVEYADGSSYYNLAAGKNKGAAEVSIRVDSTLSPVRIAGYIIARPDSKEVVRLDSISLVRLRNHLSKKYFSQRPFNYGIKAKPKKIEPDTIEAPTDTVAPDSITQQAPRHRPPHGRHLSGRQESAANSHKAVQPKQAPNTQKQNTAPPSKGGSAAQEGLRKRDEILRAGQRKK